MRKKSESKRKTREKEGKGNAGKWRERKRMREGKREREKKKKNCIWVFLIQYALDWNPIFRGKQEGCFLNPLFSLGSSRVGADYSLHISGKAFFSCQMQRLANIFFGKSVA